MTQTLNARVQQKHDTEVNWKKATAFIPKSGEIIVYDPDDNYSFPRFKIGDGKTKVNDLPFVFEPATKEDIDEICGVGANIVDEVEY